MTTEIKLEPPLKAFVRLRGRWSDVEILSVVSPGTAGSNRVRLRDSTELVVPNSLLDFTYYGRLGDMNESELRSVVFCVLRILYGDGPDTQWTAETLDEVARALGAAGLVEAESQ